MKLPSGLFDTNGASLKGHVYLSSSHEGQELQEYGLEREGNTVSCYAQTATQDVISLEFALNAGSIDFVDVVIDGIRRLSVACEKPSGEFRGTVKRVLCMERRGGLNSSLMQVKASRRCVEVFGVRVLVGWPKSRLMVSSGI